MSETLMSEKLMYELHLFDEKNIEKYKNMLSEAYFSENMCLSIPNSDIEMLSLATTLCRIGYLVDINPLSQIYKDDSTHDYIVTDRGIELLKIAFPDRIKSSYNNQEP